jgi:hypothetical protein
MWLLALLGCMPGDGPVDYRGWSIARVQLAHPDDLVRLHASGTRVLTEHALDHADVLVPPSGPPDAWAKVLTWSTLHGDLDELLDGQWRTAVPTGSFYDDWSTFTEIDQHLDDLAATSSLADVIELGTTLEGRTIRALRLGASGSGARGTVITGGMHAREWVGAASALYIAETLLDDYGVDPAVTTLLDTQKVIVVPVLNPDGYTHTWTTDRLWRKNRRDNLDGSFGIDLNRNFNDHFGGVGSSGVTTSDNYRGPDPFSEPETAALRDLLQSRPAVDRYVDLHCTGQFVLYPWGWTPLPSLDHGDYVDTADDVADAMGLPSGTPYSPGQWNTRLYPSSGTGIDWSYGVHGATSFLLELRDKGQYGFLLPAELLLPTAEEAYAGVREVLALPPSRLKLRVPALVPGARAWIETERATPGATVELYLSTTGEGVTVLGDGTELQLDGGTLIGTQVAGPAGAVTFPRFVLASATGRDAWFQAREIAGPASLVIDTQVQ